MAQAKRERSPPAAPAPPATTASSIKSAIALLSTADNVPPALCAQLLGTLGEAHGLAVKDEEERDRKRVKREPVAKKEGFAQTEDKEEEPAKEEEEPLVQPILPRWGYANVQGALTELEKVILRDVEAALPLLDKFGYLLRPVRDADGNIDLKVWEAALPMPSDSNWARALIKPIVVFPADYPRKLPKLKLPTAFFHPNVFHSGTICHHQSFAGIVTRWGDDTAKVIDKYSIVEPFIHHAISENTNFSKLPPSLRLPILFELCRQQLAHENTEDPAQLEAYQLAKKEPQQYLDKVRNIVLTLLPTALDHEDLIEAQRRAAWRDKSGVEVSMIG